VARGPGPAAGRRVVTMVRGDMSVIPDAPRLFAAANQALG
jgi:hypothetical protein